MLWPTTCGKVKIKHIAHGEAIPIKCASPIVKSIVCSVLRETSGNIEIQSEHQQTSLTI